MGKFNSRGKNMRTFEMDLLTLKTHSLRFECVRCSFLFFGTRNAMMFGGIVYIVKYVLSPWHCNEHIVARFLFVCLALSIWVALSCKHFL